MSHTVRQHGDAADFKASSGLDYHLLKQHVISQERQMLGLLLMKDARPLGLLPLSGWALSLLGQSFLVDALLPVASSQLAWAVANVFAIHFPQGLCTFNGVIEADKSVACMTTCYVRLQRLTYRSSIASPVEE